MLADVDVTGQIIQRLPVEDLPHDARGHEERPVRRIEPVDPRREQRGRGWRNLEVAQISGRSPDVAVQRQTTLIDEDADQLLCEQWVSLGRGRDPRSNLGRNIV